MPFEPFRYRATGDRATDLTFKSAEDTFRFLTDESKSLTESLATANAEIDALQADILEIENSVEFVQFDVAMPAEFPTWHLIGAAGEPPYQNSWAAFGDPSYGGKNGFRMWPDGWVELQGLYARTGAAALPSVIFALPTGHWPVINLMHVGQYVDAGGNKVAHVRVLTNGNVVLDAVAPTFTAPVTWLSLSGIRFQASGGSVRPGSFAAPFPLTIPISGRFVPTGVSVVQCTDLSGGTSAPMPNIEWSVLSATSLRIGSIFGLQPVRTYRIRLRVEA